MLLGTITKTTCCHNIKAYATAARMADELKKEANISRPALARKQFSRTLIVYLLRNRRMSRIKSPTQEHDRNTKKRAEDYSSRGASCRCHIGEIFSTRRVRKMHARCGRTHSEGNGQFHETRTSIGVAVRMWYLACYTPNTGVGRLILFDGENWFRADRIGTKWKCWTPSRSAQTRRQNMSPYKAILYIKRGSACKL